MSDNRQGKSGKVDSGKGKSGKGNARQGKQSHNRPKNQQPAHHNEAIARVPGLPARRLATVILTRIIDDKRNLDALTDMSHGLEPWLKLLSSEEGRKDQALIRAIVVTALRQRGRILYALKRLTDRPFPKNARFLHHAMHVAAAQILFMDIPDSAAVNIAVSMIGKDKRTARFKALANAVLRRMVREREELLARSGDVDLLPPWLSKQLRSDYGKEKSASFGAQLMAEAAIDLTVKSDAEGWAKKLDGVVLPTGSVRLKSRKSIPDLEGFGEGEWWVQDAAAAIPARLLGDVAGKEIADLCAAPGGKTAQLVLAGAKVTGVELSAPRMARLSQNLERLKLDAGLVQSNVLEWETEQRFDGVLLDAPCSSTGTMRRNPDVAWTRSREEISELASLQLNMVLKAAGFVKPGGILVFANCSILKAEGEDLLAKLLSLDCGLEALPIEKGEFAGLDDFINGQGAIRTLPGHFGDISGDDPRLNGMDAFFACRFRKAG